MAKKKMTRSDLETLHDKARKAVELARQRMLHEGKDLPKDVFDPVMDALHFADKAMDAEPEMEDIRPSWHVDSYVWNRYVPIDKDVSGYAQWYLMHLRLPAAKHIDWMQFLGDKRLYCTYGGVRHVVVGASRMGDIQIHRDLKAEVMGGYDGRVKITDCSDFSDQP